MNGDDSVAARNEVAVGLGAEEPLMAGRPQLLWDQLHRPPMGWLASVSRLHCI